MGTDQHSNTPPLQHSVILYTKPGCHLCDRAKEVLQRCRQQITFGLEEVDISQNPELLARYGLDIPVILLDGVEIAHHVARERNLLDLLRKSPKSSEEL